MNTASPDHSTADSQTCHPAFEAIRRTRIDSLDVIIEEYQHLATGAVHYHIAADKAENVFLVALRTVPTDSKGVAHILEHTVLCGSERYPVRDPFFMMIRRSLNTFMNAFTSSDWTAYPFASQNHKDFYNLMEVYLDAVFFARLDELDFAQEGHRVEFATATDASSDLVFKGVVFNEMKGAMSSPVSTLWQLLTTHLFPSTTYHFNSGGDPEHIPELSYDELKAFYQTHYHPSNAVFMTFGDIPAARHQEYFENQALHRFNRLDRVIDVPDEQRYSTPQRFVENYAIEEDEDGDGKTHIVVGWLLGHSTDLEAMLKAHLLSGVLLDNSAAPLRHALETSSLGAAPSPLCGIEDSNREMSFMCGIEGSEPQHTAAVEQLILDVLTDVAENGIPQDRIEAVLHQLELSQREISGDSYPYGLHLILGGLPAAVHRGDVAAALNPDPVLATLREKIRDPDFIKQLVRDTLLDNPHRITLTMKPDNKLARQRLQQETERLAVIKKQLDSNEQKHIIEQAARLEARQMQQDDPSILPKVELSDIPPQMHIVSGNRDAIGQHRITCYEQGTNGLSYQQIIIQLPDLPADIMAVLPYYTNSLTELGCAGLDYRETQAWQDRVSGGINAYTTLRGHISDEQKINGYFVLSGKALAHNNAALTELMQQTLQTVRFDELDRLRDLIAQERAHREQSITGQGHSLAMLAASSGMSPAAQWQHRLRGLAGIKTLQQLDEQIDERDRLQDLADKLQQCHQLIMRGPLQFAVIGEHEQRRQLQQDLTALWSQQVHTAEDFQPLDLPAVRKQVRQAWTTNTQVNFCAKAHATVTMNHPDAAALDVLAGFFRNGFLHRTIREMGGAYGGGASHDNDNAVFRFYSYRDPRLTETLDDFDRAIDWLLSDKHEWHQVEEAILGVIGSLDKPGSPAGEAKDAFFNDLFGRSPEQRQAHRQRLLSVTLADLQRVGEHYLHPETASIAVIGNHATLAQASALELETFSL